MWLVVLLLSVFINNVFTQEKIVVLDSGSVKGEKYWNGDYYEFYGVPYATTPKGRDKFKAPLPVTPWEGILTTNRNNILCHQSYYTELENEDLILAGEEECLTMNILTPLFASEENPLPVIVYVHSGAFSGGGGNMAKLNYLVTHDIVVISFNYRVGAFGFACLGNEDIPGNAGLKDQLAALRWIKDNVKKFGGDPENITLAGFSVGASMAEILAMSPKTDGIIKQLILESGSALSPFTINRDPFGTAWSIALSLGYNGTESLEDLTDFYLNADDKDLAVKSVNYFLTNSTFGFSPCIEKVQDGIEPLLIESPLDTFTKGNFKKIPVITGFSNMEGISRSVKFGTWREMMNENFEDFLPADLRFDSNQQKIGVSEEIKQNYFKNKVINHESLQNYIDYFSDSMFKYWILKSAFLHASASDNPVYLYEFSYVGNLNIRHNYMDRIKGASHRDQTAYILDFYSFTNNYRDLDTRERLTTMWTDFAKYGNPTKYESSLITVKWPPYTKESRNHLEIAKRLHIKEDLFKDGFEFWNKIYLKHYWNPSVAEYDPKKYIRPQSDDINKGKINNVDIPKKEKTVEIIDEKESENLKTEDTKGNLKKTKTVTKLVDGKLVKNVVQEHPTINEQETPTTIKQEKENTINKNENNQNEKESETSKTEITTEDTKGPSPSFKKTKTVTKLVDGKLVKNVVQEYPEINKQETPIEIKEEKENMIEKTVSDENKKESETSKTEKTNEDAKDPSPSFKKTKTVTKLVDGKLVKNVVQEYPEINKQETPIENKQEKENMIDKTVSDENKKESETSKTEKTNEDTKDPSPSFKKTKTVTKLVDGKLVKNVVEEDSKKSEDVEKKVVNSEDIKKQNEPNKQDNVKKNEEIH